MGDKQVDIDKLDILIKQADKFNEAMSSATSALKKASDDCGDEMKEDAIWKKQKPKIEKAITDLKKLETKSEALVQSLTDSKSKAEEMVEKLR